jgi:hypothetical protein
VNGPHRGFAGNRFSALIVFTMLVAATGSFADLAAAAGAGRNVRVRPASAALVVQPDPRPFLSVISRLCVYKGVMSDEDMRRCGVTARVGALPTIAVARAVRPQLVTTPRS